MASGGGTKVGNAYITVTPKLADGFDSKLSSKGTSTGSDYGGKFSSAANKAMGAGVVALGNLLSNAITAVSSKIGESFAQMFQSAMDYEQLAGGVEKIFDQADISGILQDANNAYKDLNMSANQYLASINQTGAAFAQTMGDQKGYDTARKGMLAIADYASGTGRSVDELTEKYSMITRATSSYQSIADQFSGILPATSKDFLEQAQAAGFLSSSYKSLTEVPVAEYQEAVTKMLEKGVADMGLAGNTALESASTMSGSLAMLESAWSNFLGGILNDTADMGELFGNLMESIGAVVTNFVPRIGLLFVRMFQQLPEAALNAIVSLPDMIQPALASVFGDGVAQTVTDSMRGAFEFVGTQVVPFVMSVIDQIMPAIESAGELVMSVLTTVAEIAGESITAIGQIVQDNWPAIQGIITSAMDIISNVMSVAWPIIQGIVTTVMGAIQNIVSVAWPIIQTVISTAVNAIQGIIGGLSTIVGVVTNIFNGVKQAITDPIGTAKKVVTDAINTIKNIINGAHLELPHFKLPHFNIDGGELPWGIGGQGKAPTISVSWYAKGGIIDGANLIGVGEAGPEMILPQNGGLMDDFSDAVAAKVDTAAVVDELRRFERIIGPIIADYAPGMSTREFNRAARTAVAYG